MRYRPISLLQIIGVNQTRTTIDQQTLFRHGLNQEMPARWQKVVKATVDQGFLYGLFTFRNLELELIYFPLFDHIHFVKIFFSESPVWIWNLWILKKAKLANLLVTVLIEFCMGFFLINKNIARICCFLHLVSIQR